MKPRAHHEHIKCSRILLFDTLISSQGAKQILVVVPSADGHDRRVNVLQIRKDISLFPKLIVVRVLHHLVPELEAKPELLLIDIAGVLQTAHLEIELVSILSAVIEWLDIIVIRSGNGTGLAKAPKERKILREKKRPVVVHVVAMKPI